MTHCQQIFSVDNFIISLTQFPIYDILSGLAGGVKLASLRAHPPQNLRPGSRHIFLFFLDISPGLDARSGDNKQIITQATLHRACHI